ncbi:DUF4118 domain-containing protein [Streptomyces sp. NPDC059002]|uniref:DUF4118 domain-containing protein n=1 Tax=Streptomyces sp. NPDC059002 TaxID=3346690 RepID=UPI00368E5CF0
MRIPPRDVAAVVTAVLAPFLAALVLLPLRDSLTRTNLALLLVVVVVAVSALGNRWAGALAALSSVAWFDFFHTEPYESFHIRDRADVETAVLLLVVGLVVSQLAARARVLRSVAVTDAEHLERLYATFRLARSGSCSPEELVERVREDLVDLLELRDCRFSRAAEPDGGPLPRLEMDGALRAEGWIWDLDLQGWPDGEIELRAVARGRIAGRFLMTPTPGAVPAPLETRLVAGDLAGLVAFALQVPEGGASRDPAAPAITGHSMVDGG